MIELKDFSSIVCKTSKCFYPAFEQLSIVFLQQKYFDDKNQPCEQILTSMFAMLVAYSLFSVIT
jgi:hypothetical protein